MLQAQKAFILYLDEVVTSRQCIPTHEWTPCKAPLKLDLKQFSKSTIATIASISFQSGVELVMNFSRSVDAKKFIKYLVKLRNLHPDKKLVIYMDRLSVHRSRLVLKKM